MLSNHCLRTDGLLKGNLTRKDGKSLANYISDTFLNIIPSYHHDSELSIITYLWNVISEFLLLYLFVQLYAEQLFGIFAPNKDGGYQKPRSVSKAIT